MKNSFKTSIYKISKASVIFVVIGILSSLYANDGQRKEKTYNAILTAYDSCGKCCGWEYDKKGVPRYNYGKLKGKEKVIGQTASGNIAQANYTLAAPRGIPFGTKIYIDFHGHNVLLGVVEDRGGAIHDKDGIIRIDIYFDSHQDALKFGRRKGKITLQELPDMDLTKIVRTL
jgi:3D (Asp-Asp-Asp) domain-containing protein